MKCIIIILIVITYLNRNGWIRGAVLDVHSVEPLPEKSPLWSLPGAIITPHVAGASDPESVCN